MGIFATGTKWETLTFTACKMLVPCAVLIVQLSHSIFCTFTEPDPDDSIFKSRSKSRKNGEVSAWSQSVLISPRYQVLSDWLHYLGQQHRFSLKARGLHHAAGTNAGPLQWPLDIISPGSSDLKTGSTTVVNKGAEMAVGTHISCAIVWEPPGHLKKTRKRRTKQWINEPPNVRKVA